MNPLSHSPLDALGELLDHPFRDLDASREPRDGVSQILRHIQPLSAKPLQSAQVHHITDAQRFLRTAFPRTFGLRSSTGAGHWKASQPTSLLCNGRSEMVPHEVSQPHGAVPGFSI